MMVKFSKHKSNLNVLTRWGLRNLLTLLWHWWHRQCATAKWVPKSLEFTDTYGFRLLWISSSNHCNCDSLSGLFRSDSVVTNRKTFGTVNNYSHCKQCSTQNQTQILHVFIGYHQLITAFWHYQLFFPFSCWLIHFCMDAYRQSALV